MSTKWSGGLVVAVFQREAEKAMKLKTLEI